MNHREAFEMFDLDGGGSIDAVELTVLIKALEMNASESEVQVLTPSS